MEKKTVLITGAGRGLGYHLAETFFYTGGYHRILTWKKSLTSFDDQDTTIVKGDIRSDETLSLLVYACLKYGVDILINNVAIYPTKAFDATTTEELKEVMDVNLIAPIILVKKLWPIFKKQGKGLIININSVAGKEAGQNEVVYSASKYGLSGFSKSLRYDASKIGVKIIDVFLGAMNTDMSRHRNNSNKFIAPEEIAHLVMNICDNAFDYSSMEMTELTINRARF